VLVLGSLLALVSGMLNAVAAALEKHQGMRTGHDRRGLLLLAALARRPLWLLAMAISASAWVCEAASLALAPVPVTATLRNAGRGLLVVGGGRWLEETFTRLELAGVVLASLGGAFTAVGAAGSTVVRRPLSNLTQVLVGLACAAGALFISRASEWLSRTATTDGRRRRSAGVATGAAVGVLYAATGVFTKEIGDRFAVFGAGGIVAVAASASLWLMIAMSVWAQSLIQHAFRRANAASVSAANATVASLGLVAAGFLLYGEKVPSGLDTVWLFGGMGLALAGTFLLISARPAAPETAQATEELARG
jgi:hypothetical protein